MVNKNEIIELFDENSRESMPLSDFYSKLASRGKSILSWTATRMTVVKAIAKTDYLTVKPVGGGYQVTVIREDEVIDHD